MLSDELTSYKQNREILLYKSYFIDFFESQSNDVQRKIEWVMNLIQTLDRVPSKFLRHVEGTDGLYEIRIEYESNQIRAFAFFGESNSIIVLNGFIKKARKTSYRELNRAIKLKFAYHEEQ